MENPSTSRPRVLIVNGNSTYLSKPLPRLFHQAGAWVVFAAKKGCSMLSSKYVDEGAVFDVDHPDAIDHLEELVVRFDPALLIVIDERLIEKILNQAEGIAPRTRRHLPSGSHFSARASFSKWAQSRDISMPESAHCRQLEDALPLLSAWKEIFIKKNGSSGGAGVTHVTGEEELSAAWKMIGPGEEVLVQKALRGIVGVTDMMVNHGKVQAWVCSEKWRTVSTYGPSIARRLCVPDGMEELAKKVASETGFHGLCGFDWVIDHEDGMPRLIEFHPRPPSGFGLGRWAGVDYVTAAAALIGTGKEGYQAPDPKAFSRKSICCYFPDHPSISIKQGHWHELLNWLPGSRCRSWALLPWDDPKLLVRLMTGWLKH